jgi:hypothetical protein
VPVLAGLTSVTLLTEPEAAATHYAHRQHLTHGDTVAVYDLGGGTFDTTVTRITSTGMEILGIPEGVEWVGGIDFDEAIMAHVDTALGGAFSALDPSDPATMIALQRIRQECIRAKAALSRHPATDVVVLLPHRHTQVPLTRAEFEAMIRAPLDATLAGLHRTMDSAKVTSDDLAGVLLVGGSSRIPLVSQLLTEDLGRPILVDPQPQHCVALGAAALVGATSNRLGGSSSRSSSGSTRAGASAGPDTTPPADPGGKGAGHGRRRIVAAAAAGAVLIIGAAVVAWILPSTPDHQTRASDPTLTHATISSQPPSPVATPVHKTHRPSPTLTHATINSQPIGPVVTKLTVAAASTSKAPVRAGHDLIVPVTVTGTAHRDGVLHGTVTADGPTGWTADPTHFTLNAHSGPIHTVVHVTLHSSSSKAVGGQHKITVTATTDHVTAHTKLPVLVFGNWTASTAAGSSFHAPNTFNGQPRTYDASNAIDGNSATFWNDDTSGQFPDTLTVTSRAAVTLSGVGFTSSVDGVPTDFTIQTLGGTTWTTRAKITGNTALNRWIPFNSPVSTTQVRIVVTASQTKNGNFTRVSELTP